MRGVWTVARKELSHILRDKVSGLILFALPALFFISIGFAISIDIQRIDLAIANTAGPKANEVISRLCDLEKVNKVVMLNSPSEVEESFARDEVSAAIVISEGEGGYNAPLKFDLFVDCVFTGNVLAIKNRINSVIKSSLIGPENDPPFTIRYLYNADLNKRMATIPGLIMIILIVVSTMIFGISINREKVNGTSRLLSLTPLGTVSIVMGKIIPYFLISLVHISYLIFLGQSVFGLGINGSFLLYFLFCALFSLNSMMIGLLVGSYCKTYEATLIICWFFIFTPNLFLSGFVMPVNNMPEAMRAISRLCSGYHFIEGYRGIAYKGTGFTENLPFISFLTIQSLVALILALLGFSRRYSKS
ncbi:MAG TPA: ABC transporter permease [Bacteroidales bacterium]|nr:ABC transporter permease [Bacteroidales bacterium]